MSLQTLPVLAGAYLHHEGRGGKEQVYLTHAFDTEENKTLCRKFSDERLGDEYGADDIHAAPSCPLCLKRDARFGGTYRPRKSVRVRKVWTEAMNMAAMEAFHTAVGPRERKAALRRLLKGQAGY